MSRRMYGIPWMLPGSALGLAVVLFSGSTLRADLSEDFDGGTTNTPLTLEFFNSDPGATFGVQPSGGNPGGFLQVTTDGITDNRNYAYFDRTAEGAYETIDFNFDLLIGPQEASADGGTFALLNTDIFGPTGGLATSAFAQPEDPAQVGVLAIGFDTWSNAAVGDPAQAGGGEGSAYNDVTLYYNGSVVDQYVHSDQSMRTMLPNGVTLDDNSWHTIEGSFDFINQTASMSINGLEVWNDLAVPGLAPFESRVMFGARTGGEDENFGVDNLTVNHVGQVEVPDTDPGPQPAPTAGNWSVREWNVFSPVASLADAEAVIANPSLQTTFVVSDGFREMINLEDKGGEGGGYSLPDAAPLVKEPFVSDIPGGQEDLVMRARSKVIIPADGQYTFGFDGDDGARLTIPGADFTLQASTPIGTGEAGTASGDTIAFNPPTGSAFTTASTFLPAGEHDIEVVWFERGGGAFVEVFAAEGVQTGADGDIVQMAQQGFAPIGLKEEIQVASGTLPTTTGDWNVRNVQVDPTAFVSSDSTPEAEVLGLNNLTDARTAVELDDSDPLVVFSLDLPDVVINYSDPDTNAAPGSGRFLDDTFFPVDLPGTDDDHFATLATTTINIPEDNDYIFGFGSDDGASLFVEGADFTILSSAGGVGEVTNDGQTMEFDINTGNSDTVGVTFLEAGEYDIEFLTWERAGGAWAEVFVGVGDSPLALSVTGRLLGSPGESFDFVIPAGLQLAGEDVATIPGDYNNNGRVEQADLDLVLLNWNESVDNLPEDWINERPTSGIIDQAELDGVLLNWNRTTPGVAAVPEPGTIVLLLIAAGLGLGLIRKR